ncbi:hypothetical protein WJX84_011727 [Apatococcus fuscideae]|uniref:Uncharacterized protein n=1 Tax=Apatococcus fuscideae TaxID=2026836 RepID=A0AAW1SR07_9CHLO
MHLEPRAEHDSSLTLEPRLRDATNQPLAFAARQKTYKMQNLMRKGSLLATFTRRKRSTKEDMSSAWDQNESLPEEFQSLQDHYQQQQQQQQHEQQTTNSDGIKMPKLPGAPSQSSSGKIKQQFPGRSKVARKCRGQQQGQRTGHLRDAGQVEALKPRMGCRWGGGIAQQSLPQRHKTTSKGSDTTSTRVSSSEASPLPEVPSARNTPFVPKQPPHSKQRPQRVAMGMRQADVKDSGRGKENEHAPSLKDSQSAAVQDAYGSSASAMDGVAEQPTEPIHLQRHASACKAVFQQKRNRFDAQAARLEGTEAKRTFTNARREEEEASFQRRPARRGQQTARSKADQDGAKLKAHPKWKQQSHMLRAAMAAARGDAPSGDCRLFLTDDVRQVMAGKA